MGVKSPLIENFLVGPLQMRCSVVTDCSSGDTVIIDGGDEPQRIIDWIESCAGIGPHWSTHNEEDTRKIERKVVALLNTHAHFDHSGHIPTLKDYYDVDWYLHPDDTFLQTLAKKAAVRYGIVLPEPAVADKSIADNQMLALGSLEFEISHTPGHTLGGCCLRLIVEDGTDHIFVGDTLFAGSVGRTDLENSGGDFDVLSNSIKTKLWPLDPKTIVHPGHGPMTTIGHEKATNPFVGDRAGESGVYGFGKYA
tara:strand:+ start:162 stop:917 length:756 start_codon:yes stop_codon:yes gene_type:complete